MVNSLPGAAAHGLPDYVVAEMNRALSDVEVSAIKGCAHLLLERCKRMPGSEGDAYLMLAGLGVQHCTAAYSAMSAALGVDVCPRGYPWTHEAQSAPGRAAGRAGMAGFIYIAKCRAMPGLLKIGLTTRQPDVRVKELSASTAVPAPFEVVAEFHVPGNVFSVERAIHADLAPARSGRSEFFYVNDADAISACSRRVGAAA